ncbi:MAG TPA: hypothetical protein VF712_03555 [Thermoleophilaceae bacterium]|jgi:hypothetical protein
MERRLGAFERREHWPNRTEGEIQADLDAEIARIEARRMVERFAAGEPWADVRAPVVRTG